MDRVVCTEFEVDERTGLRDAEAFLRELEGYGILRVSAVPIQPAEGAGVRPNGEASWAR